MSEWVNAVSTADLGPGENVIIEVDDAMIAIFNLAGEFFAIEDVCTHDGSEIASGCVIGEEIECPRHGAKFNIKTGAVTTPPAYEAIDTFPIRIVDGIVQVKDDRWD
jgi:3-phenylpropionate/trans-cinnamate dioxygenase ferredoxin subunit